MTEKIKSYSYKNINGKQTLMINGRPATEEEMKRFNKIKKVVREARVETIPIKNPIDDKFKGHFKRDRVHIHHIDTPDGERKYIQEGSKLGSARGSREKLKTTFKVFKTPEDSLRTEDYEYIKKKNKYSKKYRKSKK